MVTMQRRLCFALSGLLLAPAAFAQSAGPPRKPLDLRAPDVRRVLPAEQWRYPLPAPEDTVIVESRRKAPPPDAEKAPVPGGIAAPFWALRHPTKAWRIFVPDPNAAESGPPDPVPTLKSIQKQ